MNQASGSDQFKQLPVRDQERYLGAARQMVGFARDHAVPLIFAPPLSIGGKVNGATACVIRLSSGPVVLTASHVLEGYEEHLAAGETLNWQLGNLPPFDPLARVAWRDRNNDLVMLSLSDGEADRVGPCVIPAPAQWPPGAPAVGQHVLQAGYPRGLREVDPTEGRIGAGPYSAMLRVVSAGEGYFMCHVEPRDLISYDGSPLPAPDADFGGLSGGSVLLVRTLDYPLVGLIVEQKNLFGGLHLLRVATLQGMEAPDRPDRNGAVRP